MPKFIYKARDWSGKLIKGELDLPSQKEVVESIKDSGLIPLSIEVKSGGMFAELTKAVKGRVNLKQVSTFTRQLSTMLTAGLALTDALALLKNQYDESSGLGQIVGKTLDEVRGGMPLGKSLSAYTKVFERPILLRCRRVKRRECWTR